MLMPAKPPVYFATFGFRRCVAQKAAQKSFLANLLALPLHWEFARGTTELMRRAVVESSVPNRDYGFHVFRFISLGRDPRSRPRAPFAPADAEPSSGLAVQSGGVVEGSIAAGSGVASESVAVD